MADKTYIVKVTRYGYLKNREIVEKAAMEGRTIPPIVVYRAAGETVKLDPDSEATKRALKSGAIEEPGASEQREQEALQRQMDALQAQQDALRARMPADQVDEDDASLKDLRSEAEALGISKSGNKAELAERIAAHKASAATT